MIFGEENYLSFTPHMHTFKIMLFYCWKVNLTQSHIYFEIVVDSPVNFWLQNYSDLFVDFILEVEVEELSWVFLYKIKFYSGIRFEGLNIIPVGIEDKVAIGFTLHHHN